jgi:hypothetical protein
MPVGNQEARLEALRPITPATHVTAMPNIVSVDGSGTAVAITQFVPATGGLVFHAGGELKFTCAI